ncbi:ABC transporter permease [Niabella ginsenosidivorans]|uniref:ABC transporter permease n=1 Tax=Niabella ginsenosidivorans TaxID=1176587 RepID=A0A1A9I445_9BACT|nr:ABC transporter permease [Niabella ginsenosidivorans]ANH81462.1 ABC transporter permease [Niabella ginsenosidivorans]
MIKNYFKTAWRNLGKSRAFAVINVLGLAIGMAVAMIIGIWVWSEVSYNKGISNHKQIAKVMQNKTNKGVINTIDNTPYPLSGALRREYGNLFKQVVLAEVNETRSLRSGDKKLVLGGGFFEEGIGPLLGLHMLQGTYEGMAEPNNIMLSEATARSLFGNESVIGKTIVFADSLPLKITGIYKDLPLNSDFNNLKFIAPWTLYFNHADWIRLAPDPWRPNSFLTLVELKDPARLDQASALIKDVRLRHINERLAKQNPQLFLYPMDQWYLYDSFKNGVNNGGRIRYVWLFGIIGIFVLLLACINFMNLSTARSIKRAKEVGIRKTVGSLRNQLIIQFFCESLLYAVLAFALSLALVALSLPLFTAITGREMPAVWNDPLFWILGSIFCLFTGLLAGIYPALYLSSFRPVNVLKGSFQAGKKAGLQRQVLVVLQFTISIVLIIGTLMVFRQIRFAKNRPVGYDKNGIIAVDAGSPAIESHFAALRQKLLNSGIFESVALGSSLPTQVNNTTTGIDWPGKEPGVAGEFGAQNVTVDYGKTIGWEVTQGRDFSKDFPSDSSAVILNEAAVHFMGLKNPVGIVLTWEEKPATVIGVIKNMIMESPYADARPAVFSLENNNISFIIARIHPRANASDAVKQLEATYKSFVPDQDFHFQFIDEDFNRKFGDEERVGKLGGIFALLAVFISCLGLFGMASFMAEQRVKEIGVRKVLGASVFSLWKLLSKDFFSLVLVSIVIAVPVGWYCMHMWLQGYSYRAPIPWWIFAVSAFSAAFITLVTISVQSIKAALANPVKALRSE